MGWNRRLGPAWSQSLFYWIIYSYPLFLNTDVKRKDSLNPYFIGLSILIIMKKNLKEKMEKGLNPYFIGLSILINSSFDN